MRRTRLAALAAAFPAAPAAGCRPTPTDSCGPFGRGTPPLRATIGTGHLLTGVVLSAADCKPLRGARVELWQTGRDGRCTRATSGTVRTDAGGRFRFQGPVPGRYSGEPRIHLRVVAPAHEILVTRYVVCAGAVRGAVRLVLEPHAL